jgi:hypothetical protein
MIKLGDTVNVHYTGKLDNGDEFDTSVGKDPLSFTVGTNQVIPGFENALLGKSVGDKVTVTIPPSDAYGDWREDLTVKVPNDQLPGPVEVGTTLIAQNDQGGQFSIIVKEVHDDHVIVDGNHQLAGQQLTFDIEVMEILP